MSKVEGRGLIDPPPLMPSCDFFYLMPSRVNFSYFCYVSLDCEMKRRKRKRVISRRKKRRKSLKRLYGELNSGKLIVGPMA